MLGCKGCTFGCARTSGAQVGTRGRTGGGLEHASVHAGASSARKSVWRAAMSAGVRRRVWRRVYCSPESTSFTRNHLNDLK
ncbi:hypothetical protein CRG98_011105 [Punica granatum]|uniref:Uncharacterized protein n=1 Tax=Punica granatum TaxID=22663 RepID=A0A2I0KJ85_PUNGR|nr:hypothetical protein CRG98_011105 [Punica granatum]